MEKKIARYKELCAHLSEVLGVGRNMDAMRGEAVLAGVRCTFFYLEGFLNKQAFENVLSGARYLGAEVWKSAPSALEFVRQNLCFSSCNTDTLGGAVNKVLSGFVLLLFEGYSEELIVAEVRITPQRSIQEPTKGKTLRGPHEGFCENIVTNLALVRRRVKSTSFCATEVTVGDRTQTRMALCYLEGLADMRQVSRLLEKLRGARARAVCMGEESVTELLFYRKGLSLLNPLPRARFTERPDTCAAGLAEGKIVLLIDTTPNAILLPISLFDFFEECDNYYFPPITASYLRIVRFFTYLASIFLVPVWLLIENRLLPMAEQLSFLYVTDSYAVPIYLQLILIEFAIDALKLASLNTPEPLANSMSVVGGLLLGDFAVKSGWFVPQAILYSALASIMNFIPNNYELGYSLKFARILLIVCVQFFGLWGLVFGTAILLIALASMRDVLGQPYLYPLGPFSWEGVKKIFVRTLHGKENKQ